MSEEDTVAAAVLALVDAVNRGDMASALSAFAQDATIVEDIPPYRWMGPSAPSQWLGGMAENASKLGITSIFMEAGPPTRVDVEGSRAYAVVPGRLRLGTDGGELTAAGVITFTTVRDTGEWLIETLVWSGPRPE